MACTSSMEQGGLTESCALLAPQAKGKMVHLAGSLMAEAWMSPCLPDRHGRSKRRAAQKGRIDNAEGTG